MIIASDLRKDIESFSIKQNKQTNNNNKKAM